MENLPQLTRIQKLKNQLREIKETHAKRSYLETERIDLEKQILTLSKEEEKERFSKGERGKEREELLAGLKKKIRELDKRLDTIDEDASTPYWEIEKELTSLLLDKFPEEKDFYEKSLKRQQELKEAIENLGKVIETIDEVNAQVHQIIGTGEQSRKRGFLHFMFGKSPYLVALQKMETLKKRCQELMESSPFKNELKPFLQPVIKACGASLYLRKLAAIFEGSKKELSSHLETLTKKKVELEKELAKAEQAHEKWLFDLSKKD